jgi:hypothetical protein
MMREVLITEGNGFRIVGKNVKTYGCSNFNIFNMKLVQCSSRHETCQLPHTLPLHADHPATNLPSPPLLFLRPA